MSEISIIGGGFTGIAVLKNLKKKNISIYEASEKLGGILRDYRNLDGEFFSSCQYIDASTNWLSHMNLTEDFYKFEHNYGSYTDIFGKKTISKNFAGPVYSGRLSLKFIDKLNFTSLENRLNIYPEEISLPLINWFESIGVRTNLTHHTAIDGFQANRIYCLNMHKEISEMKSNSKFFDELYGLPREELNLKKIYSFLPRSGFNRYFDEIKKNLGNQVNLKMSCRPVRLGKYIHIKYKNKMECPKKLVWTVNPTPLFKEAFDINLDSNKHFAETIFGFLNKRVELPFYIQVYSNQSSILRIYIYNINGKGCFSVEKSYDNTDEKIIIKNAQNILSNFFSYKFQKISGKKRSTRYFVYTVRDHNLLKYYQKNNSLKNLIFTDFLTYGRNDKVDSILKQLK